VGRFLFVTWDGAGNEAPAVGIGQELRGRGHQVVFAARRRQRDRFENAGFRFLTLEPSWGHWRETAHDPIFSATSHEGWSAPGQLEALPEIVAREGCDAVVIDCLMIAAMTAAEKLRLPAVVLVHTAPGALAPPDGQFDDFLIGPINKLRAAIGLPPTESVFEAWARLPTLCTSIAELDPEAGQAPASFEFIGPCFEQLPASNWTAPWESGDDRPLILVSFSTGTAWNQTSRIESTVAAFADGPFRVVVTAGRAATGHMPAHENIVLLPHLPHAEILPEASLMVTHAGHGTVMASLAHGVPMLCLPNPAADQPALARQISALGAGVALDGETAKPQEIAEAAWHLLACGSYRESAERLASVIARSPGAPAAADLLERLASKAHAPIGDVACMSAPSFSPT
jgi:UDP:flavonoid glycosyltransferase YjiC (YdhE family)